MRVLFRSLPDSGTTNSRQRGSKPKIWVLYVAATDVFHIKEYILV